MDYKQLRQKDIALLLALYENSRKSNRQLAKSLGISKETIGKKIEEFSTEKLIRGFSLGINYAKLGFHEYHILIRFSYIDTEQIEKLISFLERHPNTNWIGKSFGRYDLKVNVMVQNPVQITKIIRDISSQVSIIEEIDSLYTVEKIKAAPQKYLQNLFSDKIEVKSFEKTPKKTKKEEKMVLDANDKNLLYVLGNNPRGTYAAISQACNLSPESLRYRIKRLEEMELITGYSIVFNANHFNKIWCLAFFTVEPAKLPKLKEKILEKNNVTTFFETLGKWNMTINFSASTIQELEQTMSELRAEFSKSIRSFDFSIFFEDIYKYPRPPEAIKK
ncbi:AsnC family transcriptional regulator [Candidatus Woesearchaeota archaeon]|nr:AsnC family transcriptional regulator [Candidatus Woesearchaeota archaeon]USN43808.1 MAG: AsnC family transcriptional regulator [Candidatus Woesearchaeota archaeon]